MFQAYDLGGRKAEFEALSGRLKAQDASLTRFRQLLARIESRFGSISNGLDTLRNDVRELSRQQHDCLPAAVSKPSNYRARFEARR